MDPISNRPPVNPASSVQGPSGAARPGEAFNMPQAGAVQATGSTTPTPSLDAMRTEIKDAMRVTQDPGQIMDRVISGRLDSQFGAAASPEMKQFVSEKLRNDPAFTSIFNRVMSEVTRD